GNADHAPPRQDDSEVGRYRFRGHGHEQRDLLPPSQAELVQPIGDPSTQSSQLTLRHLPYGVGSLESVEDGRLVRARTEAALRDIHPRAREPLRMARIEGLFENSSWFLSENDPELAEHRSPEFFPAVHGPPLQLHEGPEPTGGHQLPDVRRAHARCGLHPGRPGAFSRLTALVRKTVQSEMGREPPPRVWVRQQ